jgi:hypothetical protein
MKTFNVQRDDRLSQRVKISLIPAIPVVGKSQSEMEHQGMCAGTKKVPEALAEGLMFLHISTFYRRLLLYWTGFVVG